ncbi:MAG: SH3 domain-containing protein [Candidatus Firestonebacteria bacterium]|nr:SH3 domain-containing protein [Candidatus Firestonebacteria bacterium]
MIKKIFFTAVIIITLVMCQLVLALENNTKPQELTLIGLVTENGIRVRQDKTISSKVIGNVFKGEKITIYERSKEKEKIQEMEDYWYKIDYKGEKGWLYGYFFIAEEPVENLKAKVTSNNVHVRKDFGLGGEIVGKVFKDDEFKVLSKTAKELEVEGSKNYWYKIVLPDGTHGWIFGEFLEMETSAAIK